jgi:O-antigen ligase
MKKEKISLLSIELGLLFSLIATLPSLEAPKNIFLVLFVIVATLRQIDTPSLRGWTFWDWIFLSLITSSFISSIFAGFSPGEEWRGFRVLLTYTLVGWLVSRSNYSKKQLTWLFLAVLLSTLPPLIWAYVTMFYLHSKNDLQLHSVGHVNHSAIYLTMIFGASVGLTITSWVKSNPVQKICLISLSILLYISLIIGQSRGAFGIGLIIATTLILVLSTNRKMILGGIAILACIGALAIVLNAGIVKKEIAQQNRKDVLALRDKVWNISFEASRLYPLLGIGPNNFELITPEVLQKSVEARGAIYNVSNYHFVGHAHNIYLTALVEKGYIGLTVLIFFMLSWLRLLLSSFNEVKKYNNEGFIWAGSFSAFLATFGIGFVNTTFHHEHGILACILLGLHLTYNRINKS